MIKYTYYYLNISYGFREIFEERSAIGGYFLNTYADNNVFITTAARLQSTAIDAACP